MESFLYSLALVAVTGAAWVAYNHSVPFTLWVFFPTLALNIGAQAAFTGYNAAISNAGRAALDAARHSPNPDTAVLEAVLAQTLPMSWFYLSASITLYVGVLAMLDRFEIIKPTDRRASSR